MVVVTKRCDFTRWVSSSIWEAETGERFRWWPRSGSGDTPAMKILVLGHSGSEGGQLADPQAAWRYWLPAELSKRTGSEVELVHEKLFAHVPGAADRAGMLARRHEPDVIILPLTTHSFTVPFVVTKVRRKFGKRAGDWWERTTQKADAATRHRGPAWRRANEFSRVAALKVIGSEPLVTYAEGLEAYFEIMRRLASLEQADVLLLGAAPHAGPAGTQNKNEAKIIARFHRDIREACERQHFVFVDKIPAFEAGGYDEKFYPDGIHNNELGHRAMGEVLLAAFDAEGRVVHPE